VSKASTFQKVQGVSNLYHRGGRYYARLSIGGKPTWRSLDTDKIRAAKQKLAQFFTGKPSEVAMREEPTLYKAIDQCLEFRKSRRGISRPLSPATISGTFRPAISMMCCPTHSSAAYESSTAVG